MEAPITMVVVLDPFPVPDKVWIQQPVKSRQEGFKPDLNYIPLSELDEQTLNELCDAFKQGVFEKARKVQFNTA
jgi:hypothetical protein